MISRRARDPFQEERSDKLCRVRNDIKRLLEASLADWRQLTPTQQAALRRKLLRVVKKVFPNGDGLLK